MAYSITTAQNITQLSGKLGGDTYNINGGALTINSDSRYGPNTSPATGPVGNIVGSTPLGGSITITGANVRLIPFNSGSGPVPASGTTIIRGAAQAELLCVMALRTGGAVKAAGSAMPSSGWLKVRNATAAFSAGILAGIAASASAADETGWIEVVGVGNASITPTHLCPLTITAPWFQVGMTNGARGQTIQLPAFDATTEYPGVEIEDTPGGSYSFWPNAASNFTSDKLSTDSRSRMVSIASSGLMTIGTGRDNQPTGHLPPTGCKVRIPNVITSTASPNFSSNATPSGTMSNRYKLSCGGAAVTINGFTGSWFLNIQQPLSASLTNVHGCDQIAISRVVTPITPSGLHVGLSNQPNPLNLIPLTISQCFDGGTLTNVSALRADQTLLTSYAIMLSDLDGVWAVNGMRGHFASDASAIAGSIFFNDVETLTATDLVAVGKRVVAHNCDFLGINSLTYADGPKQPTPASAGCSAVELVNCRSAQVTGIKNWPGVANAHPYNGLVYLNDVRDSVVTGNGSVAAPYDGGTANPMGYIVNDGGNNLRGAWQRNWVKNLRVGIYSASPTSRRIQADNNYNVNATLSGAANFCDAYSRGNRHNGGTVPSVQTGVYGTCFRDAFTGDTTATATVVLVEKTSLLPAAYSVNGGSPKFTGAGGLVMANTGDRITWTWPYAVLGWTGLTGATIAGTNVVNHLIEYDIDKGAGFTGVFKVLIGLNLTAETGISPTTGFRLRLRVTCSTAAATNILSNLTINGATTLALQNAALYPLVSPLAPLAPLISLPVIDTGMTPPVTGGSGGSGSCPTAQDIASAVWSFVQANQVTAENNLLAARTAAENAFAISV